MYSVYGQSLVCVWVPGPQRVCSRGLRFLNQESSPGHDMPKRKWPRRGPVTQVMLSARRHGLPVESRSADLDSKTSVNGEAY